jgi:uncharacterized membrane protein YkoI
MTLRILACSAVLLGALWVGSQVASWPVRKPPAWQQQQELKVLQVFATEALSMDQAVKMVEQKYRARVVRTVTRHEGGRTYYEMRVLSDSGRVWTVRVDAADGSIR